MPPGLTAPLSSAPGWAGGQPSCPSQPSDHPVCPGPCTSPPPPAAPCPRPLSSMGWSLLGPNLELRRAGGRHPGPSAGPWHTALVPGPAGTRTQHRPRRCLRPQALASTPRPQGLAQGSTHCPARGWGCGHVARDPSLRAQGGWPGQLWVSGEGRGCGQAVRRELQVPWLTGLPPAQAAWTGQGGALGKEGTLGGVQNPAPCAYGPAISPPCHWPATARPRDLTQPHRACACV